MPEPGSVPEQWSNRARYDLETARAMLDTGRYVYVLFCCQQAVEKMLKAIIAQRTGQMPPRLHDLSELAERAGIALDAQQTLLMEDLSRYYIQSRYAEEMILLSRGRERPESQRVLTQTESAVQWLSSML